jgi:hypothetical protein
MAGASARVSNRVTGVVFEAAKVGAVVWGVLAVDPWVQQTFPDLPTGWRYAISAVCQVLILEVVLQLAFGWPRIDLRWMAHGDATPLRALVLNASRRTKVAESIDLELQVPTTGWLGHQLLRASMRWGVILRIRADEAPIDPSVERSSQRDGAAAVRPSTTTHGVDIELGPAPIRPGSWHWAEIKWTVTDFPDGEFNIEYQLYVPDKPGLTWLLHLIRVQRSAQTIRVVRK